MIYLVGVATSGVPVIVKKFGINPSGIDELISGLIEAGRGLSKATALGELRGLILDSKKVFIADSSKGYTVFVAGETEYSWSIARVLSELIENDSSIGETSIVDSPLIRSIDKHINFLVKENIPFRYLEDISIWDDVFTDIYIYHGHKAVWRKTIDLLDKKAQENVRKLERAVVKFSKKKKSLDEILRLIGEGRFGEAFLYGANKKGKIKAYALLAGSLTYYFLGELDIPIKYLRNLAQSLEDNIAKTAVLATIYAIHPNEYFSLANEIFKRINSDPREALLTISRFMPLFPQMARRAIERIYDEFPAPALILRATLVRSGIWHSLYSLTDIYSLAEKIRKVKEEFAVRLEALKKAKRYAVDLLELQIDIEAFILTLYQMLSSPLISKHDKIFIAKELVGFTDIIARLLEKHKLFVGLFIYWVQSISDAIDYLYDNDEEYREELMKKIRGILNIVISALSENPHKSRIIVPHLYNLASALGYILAQENTIIDEEIRLLAILHELSDPRVIHWYRDISPQTYIAFINNMLNVRAFLAIRTKSYGKLQDIIPRLIDILRWFLLREEVIIGQANEVAYMLLQAKKRRTVDLSQEERFLRLLVKIWNIQTKKREVEGKFLKMIVAGGEK